MPIITKPNYIVGNKLILRNVKASDAKFILNLRLDISKNKFLSATKMTLNNK